MTWDERAIPSPALLLDEAAVEKNLQQMLKMTGGPERLRPHIKTHKMGPLVARQIALGISKFKCATVAEAELCALEGASDVLLAYPAVGPTIGRMLTLAAQFPQIRFSVTADHPEGVQQLSSAASGAGRQLDVLLDLDCGQRRTGVPAGPEAFALYRQIASAPGLRAAGLHAYDGHLQATDPVERRRDCEAAFAPVEALRRELEKAGLPVPVLVAGGSPTFPFHAEHLDRECSPGTTIFWDFGYADKFPDLPFKPAAWVLTRVISKPGPGRLCLDLGHKAIASEGPQPRARLRELPDATAVLHSEEHLVLETPRAEEFHIGAILHAIPRHICPTVALYQEAWVQRPDGSAARWPIAARARQLTV